MFFKILIFLSVAQIFIVFAANSGVSCNNKKLIVNMHNNMRKRLAKGELPGQPKASNMQQMIWDNELEKLAQSWANNKEFEHNENRKDSRFEVGENLYLSWSTSSDKTPDWKKALESWFDEHKLYSYGPLDSDPGTGHYTQMVWANTIYLGCGFKSFKKKNMIHKLYVCNYGPSGNFLKEYPYKTGNGCENLCCSTQCKMRPYGSKC